MKGDKKNVWILMYRCGVEKPGMWSRIFRQMEQNLQVWEHDLQVWKQDLQVNGRAFTCGNIVNS